MYGDEKKTSLADRKLRSEEAEARRLSYVACTRARDHLSLTSTQAEANRLCGLSLLQPGLELANIPCSPVSFNPEDARPLELPSPSPSETSRLLTNLCVSLDRYIENFTPPHRLGLHRLLAEDIPEDSQSFPPTCWISPNVSSGAERSLAATTQRGAHARPSACRGLRSDPPFCLLGGRLSNGVCFRKVSYSAWRLTRVQSKPSNNEPGVVGLRRRARHPYPLVTYRDIFIGPVE